MRPPRTRGPAMVALALLVLAGCGASEGPDVGAALSGGAGVDVAAATATIVRADALAAGAALSAALASGETLPTRNDPGALAGLGINLTPGTTVGSLRSDAAGFAVCLQRVLPSTASGPWAVYDSRSGGLVDQGAQGPCPAR